MKCGTSDKYRKREFMIYLIGGPPKCGKTTLAKAMSKKLKIQMVSSDTLESVGRVYSEKHLTKKDLAKIYPNSLKRGKTNDETYSARTPRQIVKDYIKQGRATCDAIEMFALCEITDGNDYIIEGYHVTPQLAAKIIKKHDKKNVKAMFVVKSDTEAFIKDVTKSTTPNDWIVRQKNSKETLQKIAKMVEIYSAHFIAEAKKYKIPIVQMDQSFTKQIENTINSMTR